MGAEDGWPMEEKNADAEVSLIFFQDEKTLAKLIVEVQDTQEILNKQKTDNNVRHQNNTAGVSKLLRILVVIIV